MALELRRRRIGSGDQSVNIIDVVGRLNVPGSSQLRADIQDFLKSGIPRIALNLTECVEIKKEVFGTFHSLGRACQRAGGNLIVYGAKDDPLEYIKAFLNPDLVKWSESENEAILALGGQPEPDESDGEDSSVIVALGSDNFFQKVFWKLNVMGKVPVAKFDSIASVTDFINRSKIHSLILDPTMSGHDLIKFIRQVKSNPKLRTTGIYIIGKPSARTLALILMNEGADYFVPFVFNGEEILSRFNSREFFHQLKDAFEKFETRKKAKSV